MINLFIEYYKDNSIERQKELDYCINKNIENHFIDYIYLLVNNIADIPFKSNRIFIINIKKRLTYNDFFKQTNKFPTDINILFNADIYFDNSIYKVNELLGDKQCFALLRYNIINNSMESKIFDNRSDSQDTWIFKGSIPVIEGADFNLGIGGCDNKIAYLLNNAGYKISNPCFILKTYHYHLTEKRNYSVLFKDILPPPYLLLNPI